jgi:hypothetical protein
MEHMATTFPELLALLNATGDSKLSENLLFVEFPGNEKEKKIRVTLSLTFLKSYTAMYRYIAPTKDGPKDVVMSNQKWLYNTQDIGKKLDLWGQINGLPAEIIDCFKDSVLRKKGIIGPETHATPESSAEQSHTAPPPEDVD